MNPFKSLLQCLFPEPRRISDPVLGDMSFDRRLAEWTTLTDIELGAERAAIIVAAGEEGPSENARRSFIEFRDRWSQTRQAITPLAYEELRLWFDGARRWCESHGDEREMARIPLLAHEVDTWKFLSLSYVRIEPETEKESEFFLGIEVLNNDGGCDAEHIMHVSILDWDVVFLGIEG